MTPAGIGESHRRCTQSIHYGGIARGSHPRRWFGSGRSGPTGAAPDWRRARRRGAPGDGVRAYSRDRRRAIRPGPATSGVGLPAFLADLAPVLDRWGYLAIGVLILVEDFGVPVPGEAVLIAASVYAGTGRLNIVAVTLVAVVGAVVGDSIGYLIGCVGGRPLLARFGRDVLLTPPRVEQAERYFTRYGGAIVAVARFIEGLRQANGLLAGTVHLLLRTFLPFNRSAPPRGWAPGRPSATSRAGTSPRSGAL